jgi:hypothetical protein
MSPTNRLPGAGEVKSRPIRSGTDAATTSVLFRDLRRLRGETDDPALAHDPSDPFVVDPMTAAVQHGDDPRAPVGAPVTRSRFVGGQWRRRSLLSVGDLGTCCRPGRTSGGSGKGWEQC